MRGDYDDDYSHLLWKRKEKFSFYYPVSKIWSENPWIKKTAKILWVLFIIWLVFFIYPIINGQLVEGNESFILLFAFWVVLILLWPIAIIFTIFDKCLFRAWIYEKWISIQWMRSHLYSDDLKEIKMFHYSENWNEYIKLIYIESNERVITEDMLYNPKMDKFLERFQETFQDHWISCKNVSDIKDVDINAPIEYSSRFRFFSVRKLLSSDEKWKRIKRAGIIYLFMLFILLWMFSSWGDDESYSSSWNTKSGAIAFLVIAWVILVCIIIYFILSIKKFYVRKENNSVYINYAWISENYVLSKIKANYWIIVEWNLEWVILTIDDGDKTKIYKRPKNEEVERFCNDLLAEIKKRKEV